MDSNTEAKHKKATSSSEYEILMSHLSSNAKNTGLKCLQLMRKIKIPPDIIISLIIKILPFEHDISKMATSCKKQK